MTGDATWLCGGFSIKPTQPLTSMSNVTDEEDKIFT